MADRQLAVANCRDAILEVANLLVVARFPRANPPHRFGGQRKNLLLASASLLLVSAAPAMAADVVEGSTYEAPVAFDWTGGYIGVQGGYTGVDADLVNYGAAIWTNSPTVDAFHLGGVVGYRHQFSNNLVFGVEGDVSWLSGSTKRAWDQSTANVAEFEPNWDASIRATLGYAADRWLPYVTGGVAFLDYDLNPGSVGNPDYKVSDTAVGWTVGGGVAYAFTDNLVASIDYRYADFGKDKFDTSGALGNLTEVNLVSHKVTFGLSYKF